MGKNRKPLFVEAATGHGYILFRSEVSYLSSSKIWKFRLSMILFV